MVFGGIRFIVIGFGSVGLFLFIGIFRFLEVFIGFFIFFVMFLGFCFCC